MKIKLLSVCFILLFGSFVSFAQIVEIEEIEFNYLPMPPASSMVGSDENEEQGLWLKVKAILSARDLKDDTIRMKTTMNAIIPQLGPMNLAANLIDDEGRLFPLKSQIVHQAGVQPSENYQLFKIVVPNKKKVKFSITYNTVGDFFVYNTNSDFLSYHSKHGYFYPMDVPIKKVHFDFTLNNNDSLKYFASYRKFGEIIEDINIAVINKKRYIEESIVKNNLKVNIFVPDTLINGNTWIRKREKLDPYFDRLASYVADTTSLDVILINWRDEKYRHTNGEGLGSYCVCDIKFPAEGILHELLHLTFPSKVLDFSKGEYFIKESIIEWLTVFLSNKPINKITTTKLPKIKDSISLYDAQINNYTTWDLIYKTGPSIIQYIAGKCGEEKMAKTIISFLEKNQKEVVDYEKFIDHLRVYLSHDLVKELDEMVKM
ncbi:hypothetical protein FACS1894155_06470 [Bacteroidia bacterium]|nr:hypothetical protein FACS189455_0490 [Bacteroidia bacterium]GHU89454.1 hypothetical protein FACS1894155_06470 [Bacteroidia bacterium]